MTRQLFFTFRFAIRESVEGVKGSIANPQQVPPLAKVVLKAHALRDPEACDDTPLDLLAGLRGLAPSTIPRYLAVFRGAE